MATSNTRQRENTSANGNRHKSSRPKSRNGADSDNATVQPDDLLGQLKLQYKLQLVSLRELFSSTWNDDDLVSVLQEVGGDLEIAIARISEGEF